MELKQLVHFKQAMIEELEATIEELELKNKRLVGIIDQNTYD